MLAVQSAGEVKAMLYYHDNVYRCPWNQFLLDAMRGSLSACVRYFLGCATKNRIVSGRPVTSEREKAIMAVLSSKASGSFSNGLCH